MKSNKYKNFWSRLIFFVFSVSALFLNACEKDDDGSTKPMSITKIYLEDARSSVPDREVTFARLGQTIRLEGSGFIGVKRVYINGYSNYFNPTFVADNSMLVTIDISRVPTIDAPADVRNKIRLEKSESNFYDYAFEIRSAAPSITSISHTMPQAGDLITVYGAGLQDIASVTFPGGISVTSGIVSDNETGKFFTVTVPQGVSDDGGSILAIGANGGAYSQACFNYKKGLLHNFDDVQNYSWGSGIDNSAITDVIPSSTSNLPKSQGGYQVFNSAGNLGANADQRFWLNSNNVMPVLAAISGSTSAVDCGIQMDIYVEGEWNSGIIRFCMADGWGSSRYCMIYQPVYVNNAFVPFENPGCWFTVTLPFSISEDFEGKTLDDVLERMSAASYKQIGPWFENSGIKDVFDPVAATAKVYFDNIRFVPLTTPSFSDFPD